MALVLLFHASTVPSIIRTSCAWLFVMLAASPVTAPFSSCDLRAFFLETPMAGAAASWDRVAPGVAGPGDAVDDAYNLSPLVTRNDLPESAQSVAVPPPRIGGVLVRRNVRSPHYFSRVPHDSPARSTVLRI